MTTWETVRGWLAHSFGPHADAILLTAFIAFLLPIILHQLLYQRAPPKTLPTFILVGPSGSGKTSLLTLLERGKAAATHTSQAPVTVDVTLPDSTTAGSSRYRSENDPTAQASSRFLLVDTPGHGKLRHHSRDQLSKIDGKNSNIRGIIFMVDSANISAGDGSRAEENLSDTAEFLHDVLLSLQKRYTLAKSSKIAKDIPVLIAANKLDLFTALPTKLVTSVLENEISKIRDTRARGLKDSGIGMDDDTVADVDSEWLGEGGEGKFKFGQMQEVNIPVEIIGGNVLGAEGADVEEWWDWIAAQL